MNVLKKIAQGIGALAPTVANLVVPGSGPLLHQLMRSVTGAGPDEPIDAVAAKIEADPKLFVELQSLASRKEVELARVKLERQRVVNETMRAEAKSEHWPQYSWRPAIGFSVALSFLLQSIFVFVLAWRGISEGDADAIAVIPKLVTALVGLFSVPMAILGVAVWDRGKEKRARAGEQPRGFLSGAIRAIRGGDGG